MLALIDNYDSFSYNLVQLFGSLGANIQVFRNDQITLSELDKLNPTHLVISPGPGDPIKDGGISMSAIEHFGKKIPVLGVCLGHQCLGALFGGKIQRSRKLMHGKTSAIHHVASGIYKGIPSPFQAMRYHSLIVEKPLSDELEITAVSDDGEIMGLCHKRFPMFGVQFHPESILTEYGIQLLQNFYSIQGNSDF